MKRIYETLLSDHFANNRQMVFLSGPRQVCKTTLSGLVLPGARRFNYDKATDARIVARGADRVAEAADLADPAVARKGIVFDELHKFPKWKSLLKGFFDEYGAALPVIVTGSARLDVYKRGGDSLMGRYFPFRIHPFSAREVGGSALSFDAVFHDPGPVSDDARDALLRFGGYPEPFLRGEERFYNQWKRLRLERLFEEDLRDLSRVQDIRGVRTLSELLASRVGGGINAAALAADLSVAPDTVAAWLRILESLYWSFEVRPYFRNVAGSIRKQPKIYLWDWSLVPAGGARNENFVASHLLKAVHWWTDSGVGDFALHYLRTKSQKEVDFLVVRDGEPFLLVEAKTSAKEPLSPALTEFQRSLRAPYAFQLAVDAPATDIDPRDFQGRPVKLSALDLFKVLV